MEKGTAKFFAYLAIFFAGFDLWAILLALLGIFYFPLLVLYLLVGVSFLIWIIWESRLFFHFDLKKTYDLWAVAIFSLLTVWFLFSNATPSVFSGRDQGSFSESAVRLSKNHQLEFGNAASEEFFKIYGEGKALNFPGFNYNQKGNLTTHFPIGYIAWLAAFHSLFDLTGLVVANSVAFFIFLMSFYLVARKYVSLSASLVSLLLLSTSFAYSWFFKLTLSENLAMPLVWLAILQLLVFFFKKERLYLFASIFLFTVLAFSRLEAFAFLGMVFTILFLKRKSFPDIGKHIFKNRLFLGSAAAFGALYALNIFKNFSYFKIILRGIFGSFARDENLPGQSSFDSLAYIARVFNEYAMLDFFLISSLAVLYIIYKKKYALFWPLAVILPTFAYLFHPGISFDHPWMLRRYIFSVFPLCLLVSVWFLDSFFKRKVYLWVFSGVLLFNNLAVSFPYLDFSENENLLLQTGELSRNFQKDDLILIDREAAGSGFSMISGPMNFVFGKQAVYFFNPEDIKKIDLERFEHIYLLIPDKNLAMYQTNFLFDKLSFQRDYIITGERLGILDLDRGELWASAIELPKKENFSVEGKIYLFNKEKMR